MERTIERLAPLAAAAAVVLTACGGGGEPAADTAADGETAAATASSQEARTVDVGLTEYTIEMPRTVRAGSTVFRVSNDGTETHNFEVESGDMEEELESDLEPGETGTLEVDLSPGTYEVYCPVDDHDERGMRLELRVTEGAGSGGGAAGTASGGG